MKSAKLLVFAPMPATTDLPRLSKLLSERGVCSRRQADEWIANGWVRVDGKVVAVLGARVDPSASITIDPTATIGAADAITILVHKPASASALAPLVTEATHWSDDPSRIEWRRGHRQGLVAVAPLDSGVIGLAVLTQDGAIAARLRKAEREYLVALTAEVPPEALERLRPARVSWQNERTLRIVLSNERRGPIGRILTAAGIAAESVRRMRIGSVPLAKLPLGQWRYLARGERF